MTRFASQQPVSQFDGIQVLRFVASAVVLVAHATIYTAERLHSGVPVWRVCYRLVGRPLGRLFFPRGTEGARMPASGTGEATRSL